jgi:hypothetical protein
MSMADYFDMTGTPYPAGVGDDFYQIRNFEIGYEPGQMSPAMSNLFNEWDRTGRNGVIRPQTIEEWATENNVALTYGTDMFGNPMRYDENPFVVDALWKMAGASWDFLGDVAAGTAGGIDTIGRYLGISRFTDPTRTDASDVVSGFVDFSRRVANSSYAYMDQESRERLEASESGITSLDDVWALAMGNTQGINLEGLALMVAGELPSEMAAVVAFGVGRFGLALAGGLNATEAMGSTGESMDSRVEEMWNEGILEGSPALSLAQELFPEDDSAQLQFIQDQVRNQTLLAVGATAGLADTIGDRLAWTGLSSGRITQIGRRLILGAMADSTEEGAQQFLENLGVQQGTGVSQDLTAGVVNSMYQGAVVGTGTVAVGNATMRAAETAERIRNYFRENPTAIDELLEMSNSERHATIERLRQQFGNIDAVSMFDGIPSPDELTRGQQRQLARTGFTEHNGRRVTRAQIRAAADPNNRRLLAILQYADLDPDTNTAVLRFDSAETLQRVANTLGIDTSRLDLSDQSQVDTLRDRVEQSLEMNVNLLQTTEIETPLWSDLDDTQKMQLLNRGWTEANGARFDLETVARHSIEQNDNSLPDARYFNDLRAEITGPEPADDLPADEPPTDDLPADEPPVVTPEDIAEDIPEEINTPEDVASTRPSAQDRIAAPTPPSTDVARSHIVYNATMRLANGNMDTDVARAMLASLESNYPGITDEILRGSSIEDFTSNPDEVTSELQRDPPPRPEAPQLDQTITPPNGYDSTGGMRPPAGMEIERNGTTYRFMGRMWARVNEDGTTGSPGQVPREMQRSLSNEWRQQATTSPDRPEPPEVDTDSGEITPTVDPDVTSSRPDDLEPPELDTSPVVPDDTEPAVPDVQTDIDQPDVPDTDTDSDIELPSDTEDDDETTSPPDMPTPSLDAEPAVPDSDVEQPEAQTDVDQPDAPDVDTSPDISLRDPDTIGPPRTAPPEINIPDADTEVSPDRPESPSDNVVGDQEPDTTDQVADPEDVLDRQPDTAPEPTVDPNVAVAVAPVTAINTASATATDSDADTRTRRPDLPGVGKQKDKKLTPYTPIQLRDPLDLQRWKRFNPTIAAGGR